MKSIHSILEWIQLHILKIKKNKIANNDFFVWIPSLYSIGIASFDHDYIKMGESLNKIHFSLTHKRDGAEAARLIESLLSEVRQHFFKEEEVLKKSEYLELDEHISEHILAFGEFEDLLQKFKSGSVSGKVVINFIKHWIIGHIVDSDKKYSYFLRQQGYK